jgi:hypothetical protein
VTTVAVHSQDQRFAVAAAEPGPVPVRALTTRFLDFWLLGGASLLVWLVMISVQGFRTSWAIDQHFKNLTITTASLSLLINYPHFLISYKLAYTRGRAFILGNWWQLLAVPALLAGVFALAFFDYGIPVGQVPVVSGVATALAPFGANAQVLSGPRFGDGAVRLVAAADPPVRVLFPADAAVSLAAVPRVCLQDGGHQAENGAPPRAASHGDRGRCGAGRLAGIRIGAEYHR